MKYVHNETGEIWTGQPSTSRTSNFYLLSHDDKVALGWELVSEEAPIKSLATLKEEKISFVKYEASKTILAAYPQYKQINAALGVYDQSTTDAIKSFIQTVRTKVADYETDINAATTSEDLDFEVVF